LAVKKQVLAAGVIFIILFFSGLVFAGVRIYWLDTSGSMNRDGRIENAKEVLIREIQESKPGDILYIGSFDTNDHLIGRLVVDESGSADEKRNIITKLRNLHAKGRWTNLDEPLQASKSIMLDDRAAGQIVILSDGLSDPSADHEPVDLHRIAEIIPQSAGWSVYMIGLSQDIEGLFKVRSSVSELTVNAEYPHVKGIPVADFTHEKIAEAVDSVKVDAEIVPVEKTIITEQKRPATPIPWPIILGAALLFTVGGGLPLVFKNRSKKKLDLVLEVKGPAGAGKEVRFTLVDGKKKTVGPKGEIVVDSGDVELPPVIFTIYFFKGSLLLMPQERMSVNGEIVSDTTAILFGDIIRVRETTTISVKEGGQDDDDK